MAVTARGAARLSRAGTVAAAGISLVTVGAVMVSLLAWIARSMADMPVSFGRTPVGVLGLVLSPIFYAAVGGILAGRVPSNLIGWLFLLIGASLGMMLPVNVLVSTAHESLQPAGTIVVWAAWFRTVFGTPVVLMAAVIAVQLFPEGASLPGRWRVGVWWGLAAGGLLLLTTAVDPVGLVTYPSIPNPLALPYEERGAVAVGRTLGVIGMLVAAGVAISSLWLRYQRGGPVLRAQLRWIVLAVVVTVAGAVPFVVARYLLRVTDDTGELLSAVAQMGSCAFPLAAALAISRYRLFDIDVVISRTLVYLPMMAILGGMYTAGIALVQRLFVAFTGSESDAAIVLTVLVVASVFTPLRRSLEATVDRRFSGGIPDGRERSAVRTPTPGPPRGSEPWSGDHGGHMLQRVHLGPVAADDSVPCPLRSSVRLRDCLQCRYLLGIDDADHLTIVCNPGAQ